MSAPPEFEEANTDAIKLLQFFDKIATFEGPMEKFPNDFIRRDATVRDICKAAINVFNNTAESPHWEIPCMFNGNGSGLSFLTLFAKELMQEYAQRNPNAFDNSGISFAHCYRVFFNQGFTLGYERFHQDLEQHMKPNVQLYYKWLVASQLLLPQDEFKIHLPMRYNLVASMVQWEARGEGLKKLTYHTVCAALRRKYSIAKDAQTWILVTHEWMHSLTDSKLFPEKEDSPQKPIQTTLLYQYLMESVKFARVAKEFGINVLNIYGSYFPLNETSLLDGTGYTWAPIKMEPLTVEDSVRILSSKHPDLAIKINNLSFKRMLQHTGNIPKIWSLIEDLIRYEKFSFGAENELENSTLLQNKVENIYGGSDQINLALLLALQGWTYVEATNVLPPKPLSWMNYLFNVRTLFTINGQIYVPPIVLHSFAKWSLLHDLITRTIKDSANKMLSSGSFTSTDFEEFCIKFYILKRELFVSQGMNKVPIAEFFKGAWISPQLQHSELVLANGDNSQNLSICHASTLKTDSWASVVTSDGSKMNLPKERPVALLTHYNRHQDGLLLLPNTCIQFKMMFGNSNASLHMIENALERAETSPLRLPNERNLFVYITNCRMVDELNEQSAMQLKDTIVISADDFKKAFSPTLDYATSKITYAEAAPINEVNREGSTLRKSTNRKNYSKRKKEEDADKGDDRPKKKSKK